MSTRNATIILAIAVVLTALAAVVTVVWASYQGAVRQDEDGVIIGGTTGGDVSQSGTDSGDTVTGTEAKDYQLFVSLSEDGAALCNFGDISGCDLVSLDVSWNGTTFVPKVETVEWMNTPKAFQSSLNPSGTLLAYAQQGDRQPLRVFVLDLLSGETWDTGAGISTRGSGSWPTWVDDETVLFTANGFCDDGDCTDAERSFSQLFVHNTVTRTTTSALNDAWKQCDISDVFAVGSVLAGHGTTSSESFDDACVLSSIAQATEGTQYGPQPFIATWNNDMLVPETIDIASAGINACAHFASDGETWVCTEQNTAKNPYRLCSIPGESLASCVASGGHMVLYNRIFGWEKNANGMFTSVRGTDPLFDHLHPTELPKSSTYFNPEEDICQVYKTKQASIIGDTVLAHIYCQSKAADEGRGAETHNTYFSRAMLVEFSDPEQPVYFDLTSWFEEQFPEKFDPGTAKSYTSFMVLERK